MNICECLCKKSQKGAYGILLMLQIRACHIFCIRVSFQYFNPIARGISLRTRQQRQKENRKQGKPPSKLCRRRRAASTLAPFAVDALACSRSDAHRKTIYYTALWLLLAANRRRNPPRANNKQGVVGNNAQHTQVWWRKEMFVTAKCAPAHLQILRV